MPEPTDALTLQIVLTTGGAVAASGLITGVIQMLKRLPGVGAILDNDREALAAFIGSAVLVAVAYVNYGPWTAEGGFLAFLAWYGISELSTKIYDRAHAVVKKISG